jgi:hypothetical protein
VEDVVTPILREKTGVTATLFPQPTNLGDTSAKVVQALIAGNNLPDLFTQSYIPPQPDAQQVLVDSGAVWDFSDIPTLRRLFPNFTSRIDQRGDLSIWYENERTYNNTHIRISGDISPIALNKLYAKYRGTPFARMSVLSTLNWATGTYLRDDILTRIFPKVRTDAQQGQFFLTQFDFDNPTGASDPDSDVPIKSMNDLYNYMKKAKEIIDRENLKDGSGKDKMIVAQLNSNNGNPPSIMWSNIYMYGYYWTEPPFRVADKVYYPFQAPWVKDVLAWWNKCYNEGLLDPEVFVKKDDVLADEIVRGRFAVCNAKFDALPYAARAYAKEHNQSYGWRAINSWWPMTMKNTYNDASNQWVSYFTHFTGNIITKNVKEEDLAQVANWLDYHYSEEFDILTSWGPPSFYTGIGQDRRFKPAYKDLENFQAYAKQGGKDGIYYGICGHTPAFVPADVTNLEVYVTSFSLYPQAPMFVYPRLKTADYDTQMFMAWLGYHLERLVNFFPQRGWSTNELNSLPEFSRIQYMWFGTHGPAIAQAIRGPAKDFEANYAAYQKVFQDNDFDKGMQEYQLKWKEIFDKYIKQYWK